MSLLRKILFNFRFVKVSIFAVIIISVISIVLINIISFILSDLKQQNSNTVSLNFDLSIAEDSNYKPFTQQNFVPQEHKNFLGISSTSITNTTINSFNKIIRNETKVIIKTNKTTLKTMNSPEKMTFKLSKERPWFMTNGSLRPDPYLSEKLAIWPNEGDLNDDRIINQLMFVPLGYNQQNTKLKTIYLNTDDFDWKLSYGREEFVKCPVNTCEFVNQSYAPFADLIFLKDNFVDLYHQNERPSNQIWLLFSIESPSFTRSFASANNRINWTATYRHDSEIPTPYYKYFPYFEPNLLSANKMNINYSLGKTKKVAMIVSNCRAKNKRVEYARELQKYIQVDIYGYCGDLKCSAGDDCFKMLDKDYKFYLAFENSNCLDYITEKFWQNGLMHNVIPIAMGAHPSTYKRFAPPNSYIHVDNFESPKHLANYLHLLDKNDELYNEYFRWKGKGEIRHIEMWCRVCALLHAPKHYNVYKDLQNWWKNEKCYANTSWTHKNLQSIHLNKY